MSEQDSGQHESLISAEADTARAVEGFFDGHPLGLRAHEWVALTLEGAGSFQVKVRRTQVAFRRRRGFAYLWMDHLEVNDLAVLDGQVAAWLTEAWSAAG